VGGGHYEFINKVSGKALEVYGNSTADGGTVEFVVNSVATYTKAGFPAQRVYGSHGSSALQLVTCGGAFDHSTGSYLSNVVVYTSLVAVTPPPAPTG